MKSTILCLALAVGLGIAPALSAQPLIWAVDPAATGGELININPFTGAIVQSYALPGIGTSDTEIGLAGWSNALYYVNSDVNPALVTVIDPGDGSTVTSFSVSGGWEIDGLGYYADGGGSFLYTSGCSVGDMHRYNATDGASPQFYWSDASGPQAVAGDNGGRIFTYSTTEAGGPWGVYEVDPLTDTSLTWFCDSPTDSVVGMAFDGTYLYISDTDNMLYTLDIGGNVVNSLELNNPLYALGSSEGSPNPGVPAPGALVLGLLGAGIVSWMRRSRTL